MQKEPFEPKKLAPLRILEILKEGSDEAHPMTQTEIAERLERDFGIVLERKAVARNLQMLGDAGYAVVSCGRKRGVYLTSRPFEAEELQMLVDSVLFSRHILQNDANALVKKLCSVDAVARPFSFVQSMASAKGTQAKDVSAFVDLLCGAIENKKQVCFLYNAYGSDKALHPVWEMPRYVNPYRLVAADDRYYLIGNVDTYDNRMRFRLDKISQLKSTDRPCKDIGETGEELPFQGASPLQFAAEDGEISVTARLSRQGLETLLDAFGDDFTVCEEEDDAMVVSMCVREEDAFRWALQNGDVVEILGPQSLRDRLRLAVGKLRRRYLKANVDAYAETMERAERSGSLEVVGIHARVRLEKQSFSRLWRIVLANTDVRDLSFIAACGGLKEFSASACPVFDGSVLARLPALQTVELRTTNVASLAFLRGMTLKRLVLADNPITDFSPLYAMKGLSVLVTGSFTAREIDVGRLRACYPGIRICVEEGTEERAPACYLQAASGRYPTNVLCAVFGGGKALRTDEAGLEKFLLECIPARLQEEEAQFFFRHFRDGRNYAQIAVEQGIPVAMLLSREARVLRKLRQPHFSRLLGKFLREDNGGAHA